MVVSVNVLINIFTSAIVRTYSYTHTCKCASNGSCDRPLHTHTHTHKRAILLAHMSVNMYVVVCVLVWLTRSFGVWSAAGWCCVGNEIIVESHRLIRLNSFQLKCICAYVLVWQVCCVCVWEFGIWLHLLVKLQASSIASLVALLM